MIRVIYFFIFTVLSLVAGAQKTQSIIYDAAAIMNAKCGVNALLLPKARGFDVVQPLTGKKEAGVTVVPDAFKQSGDSWNLIVGILRRNAGLDETVNEEGVLKAYTSNPFLKFITDKDKAPTTAVDLSTIGPYEVSKNSGGIGEDILGNLVNGTADFLIKRAQEEISISIFEKLQKILETYPEFNTLFPSTCALIKPVNAYEYHKAIVAFKSAVNEDLQGFVGHIPSLYEIPRYRTLNQKVPALTLLFSATTVYDGLTDQNFAGTMNALGKQGYLEEKNNYAGIVKVSTIVSNSLLDKSIADEDAKPFSYINKDFIRVATHGNLDLVAYLSKAYLCLLWQQTKDIPFTIRDQAMSFADLLTRWSTDAKVYEVLGGINEALSTIQVIDDKLKKIKSDEKAAQMLGHNSVNAKHFAVVTELVNGSLGLTNIFIDNGNATTKTRLQELQRQWPSFAASVSSMVMNFQSEEYNLAISNFEKVLTIVSDYLEGVEKDKGATKSLVTSISDSLDARVKSFNDAITDLNKKLKALVITNDPAKDINIEAERQEIQKAIAGLDEKIKGLQKEKKDLGTNLFALKKVIRYTNLLASVSKAENSAAVEQLLEAYALPAGSSRIKKITPFNIAVNAYVGGFFERKAHEGKGFTNTYGLTAPIGFAFSTGFQKTGSLSLFLGAFDIGSTIRYKLDNNGQYQQHISLAGIVSPSVQVIYGFPFFLPISAGVGCQWVSPVTSASSKIHLKPGFNAFIGVDIPLFNLTGTKDLK